MANSNNPMNFNNEMIRVQAELTAEREKKAKESQSKQKKLAMASFVRYLTADDAIKAIKQYAYDNRDNAYKELLKNNVEPARIPELRNELKVHQTYVDWIEKAEKDGKKALQELLHKEEEKNSQDQNNSPD